MGSFERWALVIGSILQHVGIPGFLANFAENKTISDDDAMQWKAFILLLSERHSTFSVKDLMPFILEPNSPARSELPDTLADLPPEKLRARLGRELKARRDRVFSQKNDQGVIVRTVRLCLELDTHTKTNRFVFKVTGFAGDAGDAVVDSKPTRGEIRNSAKIKNNEIVNSSSVECETSPASPASPAVAAVAAHVISHGPVAYYAPAPGDPATDEICRQCDKRGLWTLQGDVWLCKRCHTPFLPAVEVH
jgi:hypothetical protein